MNMALHVSFQLIYIYIDFFLISNFLISVHLNGKY
uniref:Uncharacterized protein n=1 Tax=Arundo donax TaxID=35708 RepID=A0A0A9CQI3_ARUDO